MAQSAMLKHRRAQGLDNFLQMLKRGAEAGNDLGAHQSHTFRDQEGREGGRENQEEEEEEENEKDEEDEK